LRRLSSRPFIASLCLFSYNEQDNMGL